MSTQNKTAKTVAATPEKSAQQLADDYAAKCRKANKWPKSETVAANQSTKTKAITSESNAPRVSNKVYWRNLDDRSQITSSESGFTYNGRLIYWHGHEASEAQNWLADEAQIQRKQASERTRTLKEIAGDRLIRIFELEHQRDELLAAARKVEAHSYHSKFGDRDDHYVIDLDAMDSLCEQIGKITRQVKRVAIANAEGKP